MKKIKLIIFSLTLIVLFLAFLCTISDQRRNRIRYKSRKFNYYRRGTIRFDGSDFEGYDGINWKSFTSGGGSSLWTANASDIYYNTGNIGLGTMTPAEIIHILGISDKEIKVEVSGGASDAVVHLSNSDNFFDNLVMEKHGPTASGTFGDGTPLAGTASVTAGVGAERMVIGTFASDAPLHILQMQLHECISMKMVKLVLELHHQMRALISIQQIQRRCIGMQA